MGGGGYIFLTKIKVGVFSFPTTFEGGVIFLKFKLITFIANSIYYVILPAMCQVGGISHFLTQS